MEDRAYRLIETLGEGGFGTVYRAEMVSEGGFSKQVALKVLRSDLEMPEEIALRLRDEARMLGHVRHRAVVGVDGLAHLDAGWAVVMEYVDGVDAKALVAAGPTPPRAALEIIEEAASALHAAYYARPLGSEAPLRLIHRDIKPANVRITPTGEVKVLDFGVARADFGTREAETRGMMYGTLTYMAPERIEGESGPEGDVFALGWMLLDLLVGEDRNTAPPLMPARYRPFLEERLDRLRGLLGGSAPPVGAAEQDELIRFILHMVQLEPEDRPTARDVERTCRTLRAAMPGLWLRDWCEDNVPALMSARVSASGPDQSTGRLLRMRQDSIVWEPETPRPEGDHPRNLAKPVDSGPVGRPGPLSESGEFSPVAAPPPIQVEPPKLAVEAPSAPDAAPTARPEPVTPMMPVEVPARRPVALIAAAAVLLIGLGVVFATRGGDAPSTTPPTEATTAPVSPPVTAPVTPPEATREAAPEPTTPTAPEPTAPVETVAPAETSRATPTGAKRAAPTAHKDEAPRAPAASVALGRVVASGDAKEIKLTRDGRTHGPGNLPAGTYHALATFPDGNQLDIGSVTVTADTTITIKCASSLNNCVVR